MAVPPSQREKDASQGAAQRQWPQIWAGAEICRYNDRYILTLIILDNPWYTLMMHTKIVDISDQVRPRSLSPTKQLDLQKKYAQAPRLQKFISSLDPRLEWLPYAIWKSCFEISFISTRIELIASMHTTAGRAHQTAWWGTDHNSSSFQPASREHGRAGTTECLNIPH